MSVLKDVYCCKCGTIRDAMMDADDEIVELECTRCGKPRQHVDNCSGGCSPDTRWRFMDWDGFDPTGHIEHMGVKAGIPEPDAIDTAKESASATDSTHWKTGQVLHEAERFGNDRIAERRDQRRFTNDQKTGKARIWFH